MKKTEQASRVRAISEYLNGIGHDVTNVQCYEILARAMGLKNKHVLASLAKDDVQVPRPGVPATVMLDGETVPVMALEAKPYTVAEMQALDWTFDVVMPFSLDELQGDDIERQNELASLFITGNDYALEDLCFDHVPEVNYGKGYAAYRVTASISSPEDIFEEVQAEADARFYAGLLDLVERIEDGQSVVMAMGQDKPQSLVIRNIDTGLLALLKSYAETAGANNAEVQKWACAAVMEFRDDTTPPDETGFRVELGDLKYATKTSEHGWFVSLYQTGTQLSFNV